jgi:hypothetical protein
MSNVANSKTENQRDPDPSAELTWLSTDLAQLQWDVEQLGRDLDAVDRAPVHEHAMRLLADIIGTVGAMIAEEKRGAK